MIAKHNSLLWLFFNCGFNPRVTVWIMRWVFLCWLLQDLGVRLLSWSLEDECSSSLVFRRSRGDLHLNAPVTFALHTLEMYFLDVACVIYMVAVINTIWLFLKFDSVFEINIISSQNLPEHSDSECEEWQSLHSSWCPHLCDWHCSGMFGGRDDEIKHLEINLINASAKMQMIILALINDSQMSLAIAVFFCHLFYITDYYLILNNVTRGRY